VNETILAREAPSTSTLTVPSAASAIAAHLASVPMSKIASGSGSSSAAFHLGGKQDLLFLTHNLFQRLDRLFTPDKERKRSCAGTHDVAQWEDCEDAVAGSLGYFGHCPTFHVAAAN